jgi:hypothetical protein
LALLAGKGFDLALANSRVTILADDSRILFVMETDLGISRNIRTIMTTDAANEKGF